MVSVPIARLIATVVDCPDPLTLGRFYAELIGGTVAHESPEWVQVNVDGRPVLAFQRVDDYRPPTWPTGDRPQYLHLDVEVDDLDASEPAVVALGATKAAEQPTPEEFRVYLDPAGHPFCTVRIGARGLRSPGAAPGTLAAWGKASDAWRVGWGASSPPPPSGPWSRGCSAAIAASGSATRGCTCSPPTHRRPPHAG